MSEVAELADPKLRAIAKRALRGLQLEAEKVIANIADPVTYPRTPASDDPTRNSSAEEVLAAWFTRLDKSKLEAAINRVMVSAKADETERQAFYGELAKVDYQSPVPMFDQALALPLPDDVRMPLDYLASLTRFEGQIITPCALQPAPENPPVLEESVARSARVARTVEASLTGTNNKLEFRIHRVKCIDETDPEFFGDDEISLGGTTVDQSGITRKVNPFVVRSDFDDGESQFYSPARRFTSFDLTAGTTFPKTYVVTLVLAETDMGGLQDFIDLLWQKTKGQVLAWISAAVGGVIGSTVPILGTIIGAAVGYIVGLLVNWLITLLGDDVFPAFTTSVTIPSLSHTFNGQTDSPNASRFFTGYGGKYEVVFDWRLFS
jgi:hypothetical protein